MSSTPDFADRSWLRLATGFPVGSMIVLGGVAALLLWLLMERLAPASELAAALAAANWRLLPLAVCLAAANLAAGVWRWKLVLHAMREEVSFKRCLSIMLGVFPLVLLAPSRSNELLRGVALRQEIPLSTGIGSVVVERVIDLFSLLLLLIVGNLLGARWPIFWAALAVLALAILVSIEVLPRLSSGANEPGGPVRSSLRRFSTAIVSVRDEPARLSLAFLASLVTWLLACAMLFVLLSIFEAPLPWEVILMAWPVAALAGTLPITLAGMGTRDGAFLLTLIWLGVSPASEAAVLSATLAYAALGIWLWVLVGTPFMIRLGFLEMQGIQSHLPLEGRNDATP